MRRLAARVARDLALLPITAVTVYLVVMHLPYKLDADGKHDQLVYDQHLRMEALLGHGTVTDSLIPWRRLLAGESVALRGAPFTLHDFREAVGTSLGLGLAALALALLGAFGYALVHVLLEGRRAMRVLEAFASVVFGTPTFVLAAVVVLAAVALGIAFDRSAVLASTCMAIAPGTFIGVVLSDALARERGRPYFVTALASGLSRRDALLRHALPNALPALLDAVTPVAASLLAGSFVCETFFQLRGFGLVYLSAAKIADPGVVVIATTIFATLLLGVSLVVEVVRYFVDPKARDAFENGTE